MNKIEIGLAIKKARINQNVSATELAKKAKVAKSSISDWELGKTQPSAEALFKICSALNITPNDLLNINQNKNPESENTIRLIARGGTVKEFRVNEEKRKAIETLLGDDYIDPDALK